MIIHAISEVATQMVALAGDVQAEGVGDVCAKAPTGVEPYVNDILGWVKYGVIAIIIGAGFASIGAMIVGKFGSDGPSRADRRLGPVLDRDRRDRVRRDLRHPQRHRRERLLTCSTGPDASTSQELADPETEWTRRRLQILLGAAAVVVLAMVAGGVWSVVSMLTGSAVRRQHRVRFGTVRAGPARQQATARGAPGGRTAREACRRARPAHSRSRHRWRWGRSVSRPGSRTRPRAPWPSWPRSTRPR